MPELWPDLHQLHVLGGVQEPVPDDTIPDNGEGTLGDFCAWRRLDQLITDHPGAYKLVLASNTGGWLQGKGGVVFHWHSRAIEGGGN